MAVLDVVTAEFHDAATKVGESVASQLRLSWLELTIALETSTGMAGSDDAGAAWGASYDTAAGSANLAVRDLINASSHVGALLDQTGVNYARAEAASVRDGGADTSTGRFAHDWCDYLDDVADSFAPSGVEPPHGWSLLATLIQRAWPNGHQDHLHAAADAWRRAASQVRASLDDVVDAYRIVYRQGVPESDAAATVLDSIGDQVVTIAQEFEAIAAGCDDYAHHLDQTHHAVIGELRDFLIWTAGIEAAGGLFSIITFGASEAAAQATEAYTMARFANTIRSLIELLVAAARTTSVAVNAAAARIVVVSERLSPVLARHLEEVRIAMASDRGEMEIGWGLPSKGTTAGNTTPVGKALTELDDAATIGPASETWGNMSTLTDHFERHGPDFGAISEEDYARMAVAFLRRALREKLPMKVQKIKNTVRFYDPATNTFGSYSLAGETRTFFKPVDGAKFWSTQKGTLVHG